MAVESFVVKKKSSNEGTNSNQSKPNNHINHNQSSDDYSVTPDTSKSDGLQSRDQQRAKHALKIIEQMQANKLETSAVKSAVSGLPAMIHMNGLGHAFAFYLSDPKKFPARQAVVKAVFDWLNKHSHVYANLSNHSQLTPLKAVTLSDLTTHQIAQQEAQAYLLWLKKFSRALLSDSDS